MGHPANNLLPCPGCGAPPPGPNHTTPHWQCPACRGIVERTRPSGGPIAGVARMAFPGEEVRRFAATLEASTRRVHELIALHGDADRIWLSMSEEVRTLVAGLPVRTRVPAALILDGPLKEGDELYASSGGRPFITGDTAKQFGLPDPLPATDGISLLPYAKTSHLRVWAAVAVPAGTILTIRGCWGWTGPMAKVAIETHAPDPRPRFAGWRAPCVIHTGPEEVEPA